MIPKFRAWLKKEKRMVDVNLIDFHLKEIGIDIVEDGEKITQLFKFNDIVLMQSTGLKDKHDKEIFEGDILDISAYDDWVHVVVEKEKDIENFTLSGQYYFEYLCNRRNFGHTFIIGNIYENPELLKGGNKSDKN